MAPALSEGFQATVGMEDTGSPGPGTGGGFLKDSQEMERILSEVDLLRVMEAVETFGGELLPEEELPAGSSHGALERAVASQAKLERRCQFLARRLRMQQARYMGKHAAEETRAVVASACGGRAPAPLQRLGNVNWKPPQGLPASTGALSCQLSQVSHQLDSDATLSSSGAESDDEIVVYNNQMQQTMPLRNRALWKWSQERSSIASRWGWLQAQIQEVEHRIRQHSEFLRRTRSLKGPPTVLEPPSGYSGPLPGDKNEVEDCARIRPLDRANFRKRRLVQMHNLHTAADKAARPSDIRCICQWPLSGCAVCTGRALPTHPLPHNSTLNKRERLSLVDPAFHPVLSDVRDVSSSIYYSALMKDPQWQQKSSKTCVKVVKSLSAKAPHGGVMVSSGMSSNKLLYHTPNATVNNVNNSLVNNSANMSSKVRDLKRKRNRRSRRNTSAVRRRTSLEAGEELASGGSSPVPSPSDHHRFRIRDRERTRLNSSYDIDNIVIPHSIAASTKLEILQYKEILTPKWRVIDERAPNTNGIVRKLSVSIVEEKESDIEDLSEAGVLARHDRCESLEKGKYLKNRKNSRRQNSRTTPTQTPPHTPMNVDETSMGSEQQQFNSGVETATTSGANGLIQPPPATQMSSGGSTPETLTTTTTTTGAVMLAAASVGGLTATIPCTVSLVPLTTAAASDCGVGHTGNTIGSKRRPTEDSVEAIPPYSPRAFPLTDETYNKMLKTMPENHPLTGADLSSSRSRADSNRASDSETSSMYKNNCYTPMNLDVPSESESDAHSPAEDPTDPEWNVSASAERHHR